MPQVMAPSFDPLFCREVIGVESEWEGNGGRLNGDLNDGAMQKSGTPSCELLELEDDDAIELLLEKEDNLVMQMQDYMGSYGKTVDEKGDRMEVVNWMLNARAYHGFSHMTALLSVNYLDRFLAKHPCARGKKWWLQLIAVGCISIAAKLEEVEVPHLLDLQVGLPLHVFQSCTVQRMELLILSTLNWQMCSITPHSYLHYLLCKLAVPRESWREVSLCAEELSLYTCRDVRFLVYSPSVVAVACVMCACEEEMPSQAPHLRLALLSLWPHKSMMAMECLKLIEEILQVDPFWTSTTNIASRSSSLAAPHSPMGVLEAACLSSESSELACPSALNTPPSSVTANHSTTNNIQQKLPTNAVASPPRANSLACARTITVAGLLVPPPLPPHPSSRKRKLNEQYKIKKMSSPTGRASHNSL